MVPAQHLSKLVPPSRTHVSIEQTSPGHGNRITCLIIHVVAVALKYRKKVKEMR